MSLSEEILFATFCAECRKRMLRALDIMAQFGNEPPDAAAYDRLHQEFDSLVGASRAVNNASLERFFRAMASLSRLMRDQLPAPASAEQLHLLKLGLVMGTQCSGNPQSCLSNGQNKVEEIIHAIEINLASSNN